MGSKYILEAFEGKGLALAAECLSLTGHPQKQLEAFKSMLSWRDYETTSEIMMTVVGFLSQYNINRAQDLLYQGKSNVAKQSFRARGRAKAYECLDCPNSKHDSFRGLLNISNYDTVSQVVATTIGFLSVASEDYLRKLILYANK